MVIVNLVSALTHSLRTATFAAEINTTVSRAGSRRSETKTTSDDNMEFPASHSDTLLLD